MSMKLAAARGIIWTSVERWGKQFLGIAVFTILARILDKEEFGLVALAGVYIAFVEMFIRQGLGEALVQRKELKPSHLDMAFWLTIILALLLAALTIIFRNSLSIILKNERVAPVLAWLAVGIPLMALSIVPGALLTRELKFKSLALRTMVGTTFGGCVGVTLAILGFGVWSLVAQQLLSAVAGVVCVWSSVRWRPGVQANRSAFTDLLPFCGGVLANNLLWFVSQRVDQAIIGTGLGIAALGVYTVAQRVVSFGMEMLAAPSQIVAMPAFSKIQDDPERLGHTFVRSTSLMCSLTLPAFLGILLVGPRLIPEVFGTKWEAAILPMQILCVAGMFRAVQMFVHPTFMALGRVGLYTWVFVIDAFVTAIGCWLVASQGVAAVAWAVVVAAGITGILNFLVISRLVSLSFTTLAAMTWPILIACGIMALTILGIARVLNGHVHELIMIVAQIVVGVTSYVVAIAIFARELRGELWGIVKLMRNQKRTLQPVA